jgi:hypothetical protein
MSRGQWSVRPTEVKRAVKTLHELGYAVCGVVFTKDGFTITTGKPGAAGAANGNTANEWDEILTTDGEAESKIRQ